MKKWLLLTALLSCIPMTSGCGGGASYSDSNGPSKAGTGTLVVQVNSASGGSVEDGTAVVYLDKRAIPVFGGAVRFHDIPPKKYDVVVRPIGAGLPGESREVEIKADKTLNITLTL